MQRQQEMCVDIAACPFEVEVRQGGVIGTGTRDQHVVDRRGQLVEELLEPVEVGGVEGGDARLELEAGPVQTIQIPRREDHAGSFLAGAPSRLEPMPELPPITTRVWPASCCSRLMTPLPLDPSYSDAKTLQGTRAATTPSNISCELLPIYSGTGAPARDRRGKAA